MNIYVLTTISRYTYDEDFKSVRAFKTLAGAKKAMKQAINEFKTEHEGKIFDEILREDYFYICDIGMECDYYMDGNIDKVELEQ